MASHLYDPYSKNGRVTLIEGTIVSSHLWPKYEMWHIICDHSMTLKYMLFNVKKLKKEWIHFMYKDNIFAGDIMNTVNVCFSLKLN